MPTARTVPELLEYHGRSVVALWVLDGAVDALGVVERKRFPRRREGVVEVLEGMRDELDDEVVLAIIASAERTLRLDFQARLGGKLAAAVRFSRYFNKSGLHDTTPEVAAAVVEELVKKIHAHSADFPLP